MPINRSKITSKIDLLMKNAKCMPKVTSKTTPISTQNHKKSEFGPRAGPEPSQDRPGTPKVLQKLPKMIPKGTQNDEKVTPGVSKAMVFTGHRSQTYSWKA